jgi:indolepyruvate ferredoxin oxidoreductase beta subunit
MKKGTTNVLLAGVGGQGVILASDIMCEVFMQAGYDVKKSEIHGMAMRGGIVTSHFRFGKKVYSPLIKEGEVDILFAFEQLEGLRWINHLRSKGKIIANDHKVNPCGQLGRDGVPPRRFLRRLKTSSRFLSRQGDRLPLQMGDACGGQCVLQGNVKVFLRSRRICG